jgi:hypothetical protein
MVGLLPGHEVQWPQLWAQYSERSGQTLDDLQFSEEEQRLRL